VITKRRIAVVGAGSWGTAMAVVSARAGYDVRVWSRDRKIVESINTLQFNPKHLSTITFPDEVVATSEFADALDGSTLVLLAVPSHAAREVLTLMKPHMPGSSTVVSLTKGMEIETGLRISEVVCQLFGEAFKNRFVCLSGPSFAKEVVQDHPTAIVAASSDQVVAHEVQTALSFRNLRIYTNEDVVGTELCGSIKNVMAIAAGMTAGLGLGSNSVAALITRGLAEMTRLVVKCGGQFETMVGLAGLGDLVLTCTGQLSRNRFVGEQLGQGKSLNEITAGMTEVAEGIKTSKAVKRLADEADIEMPITNEVVAVLYGGKAPRDAVTELMSRRLKSESD
jgi:glycerol-3-phosphate dehydrogenase (NAD(P)+)